MSTQLEKIKGKFYLARLNSALLQYLLDDFIFIAAAKLIVKLLLRGLSQHTLSSMPTTKIRHIVSNEAISSFQTLDFRGRWTNL